MARKVQPRQKAALARELMLAPLVIGMRMPILAAEALSEAGKPRPESMQAMTEKIAALGEGVVAAQLAWFGGLALLPLEMARSASPIAAFQELCEEVAVAALKPAGRAVRRNHNRLSRRK